MVQGIQPPTDAYTIAALWYQAMGCLGTGIYLLFLTPKRPFDQTRQRP
jgi:hypothetical protein